MNRVLPVFFGLCLALASLAGADPAPGPTAPIPLEAYGAVGNSLVHDNRLSRLGWTDAQIEAFISGVRAGFRGEQRPVDAATQELFARIGQQMRAWEEAEHRRQFGAEAFAQPGRLAAYLKQMRQQFGMEASDSGLCYAFQTRGYGARPGPDDTVVVSYKVNQADAKTELPDLMVTRRKVTVSDQLPGLAEALQMMTVDSLALLILPPDLSYGAGKWPPGVEPGTPLLYTVKLHEIVAAR